MDPNLLYLVQVTSQFFVSKWISCKKKVAQTQPNCHLVPCKVSSIGWQIIISAHDILLTYWKFEEILSFVLINYCLTVCKISIEVLSELSSKNHGTKKWNLCILLVLLLHNTVGIRFASCKKTGISQIVCSTINMFLLPLTSDKHLTV